MIPKNLVEQIERHSDQLTHEVLQTVGNDARAGAYQTLPESELRDAADELFRHLGLWLTSRTDSAIESRYLKIGRERFHQGIPLSQVIHALGLVKSTLIRFLRGSTVGNAADLHLEYELILSISEFFDKAVYYGSRGYEDARAAESASPQAEEIEVSGISVRVRPKEAEAQATEWNPSISRGGDVGEVSG